jgi:hypothetical protein
MSDMLTIQIQGFIKISDPNNGEVLLEKKNAIHYENMSEAMAYTLSDRGYGSIYQMAVGNGGASIDETGIITYLPPNTTGQNAALYNQTYAKIVDDTLSTNTNAARNRMIVSHVNGKVYTDILVQCLLDYGEPAGQQAFDNATNNDGLYVFDELGLLANYGTDSTGAINTKLLSHAIFHPVQKALNRQIQIDYTVRIQTITNLVTI